MLSKDREQGFVGLSSLVSYHERVANVTVSTDDHKGRPYYRCFMQNVCCCIVEATLVVVRLSLELMGAKLGHNYPIWL